MKLINLSSDMACSAFPPILPEFSQIRTLTYKTIHNKYQEILCTEKIPKYTQHNSQLPFCYRQIE